MERFIGKRARFDDPPFPLGKIIYGPLSAIL
jgi:hypothetical protein